VIGKIIIEAGDIVAGIVDLSRKIIGAYSLVVLSQEGIYATRTFTDSASYLGKDANRYAVSSESRALQNLEMDVVRMCDR